MADDATIKIHVDGKQRQRAEVLADSIGTTIDGGTSLVMWPLPILEQLSTLVQRLVRIQQTQDKINKDLTRVVSDIGRRLTLLEERVNGKGTTSGDTPAGSKDDQAERAEEADQGAVT